MYIESERETMSKIRKVGDRVRMKSGMYSVVTAVELFEKGDEGVVVRCHEPTPTGQVITVDFNQGGNSDVYLHGQWSTSADNTDLINRSKTMSKNTNNS